MDSPILEIAISLILVYFAFSSLISAILESLNSIYEVRSRFLYNAISEVLHDKILGKNLTNSFYNHPSIDLLKKHQDTLPSYISGKAFAIGVFESVSDLYDQNNGRFVNKDEKFEYIVDQPITDTYEKFKAGVNTLPQSDLKIFLQSFMQNDKGNNLPVQVLNDNLSTWFDNYMDRVNGWFKRKMRKPLFTLGLLIAVLFNVDSINLTKELHRDAALRNHLVQKSIELNEQGNISVETKEYLSSLNLPIGWDFGLKSRSFFDQFLGKENGVSPGNSYWILKILGWLITAFALSRGAPFWFDLLKRTVNMRNTGKEPKTT